MKQNKATKASPERSRKGAADVNAKKMFRADVRNAAQRTRQHEEERPDRGGPQGRKDKDFQRKF